MSERLQRKRVKGWRKPEGAMIVDRTSRWGNPFREGSSVVVSDGNGGMTMKPIDRELAVSMFRTYALARAGLEPDWLKPLKGRDLMCFCPLDSPCHADVLLSLANDPNPARAGGE